MAAQKTNTEPWFYSDGIGWERYTTEIETKLEAALTTQTMTTVDFFVGGKPYQVDLRAMRQQRLDNNSLLPRRVHRGAAPPVDIPMPGATFHRNSASASVAAPLQLASPPPSPGHQSPKERLMANLCPKVDLGADGFPQDWKIRSDEGGTVRLEKDTDEFKAVIGMWSKTKFGYGEVTIYRIEHPARWKRFKDALQQQGQLKGCNQFWMFHGSSAKAIQSIIEKDGIDPDRIQRGVYGKGAYFSPMASISHAYSPMDGFSGEHHMLLCRVALNRADIGQHFMDSPPEGCDATCNPEFSIFCKFDNSHIYESYVISYKKSCI